jgi:hypothetical protein
MITVQETKINEITQQIDSLNLELKQKDQECRLNALKINELKRQLRLATMNKPQADTPSISSKNYVPENPSRETKISKDVEQIKRDMQAESEVNRKQPSISDITESKKPEIAKEVLVKTKEDQEKVSEQTHTEAKKDVIPPLPVQVPKVNPEPQIPATIKQEEKKAIPEVLPKKPDIKVAQEIEKFVEPKPKLEPEPESKKIVKPEPEPEIKKVAQKEPEPEVKKIVQPVSMPMPVQEPEIKKTQADPGIANTKPLAEMDQKMSEPEADAKKENPQQQAR